MGGDHRLHGATFSPDCIDRCSRHPGDDPAYPQVFWGPMAVSIMGGLVVATLLTCLFLPALYAAWYRVREETAP